MGLESPLLPLKRYFPFLAAELEALLEKLPLETWPLLFFAVALWMREASLWVIALLLVLFELDFVAI